MDTNQRGSSFGITGGDTSRAETEGSGYIEIEGKGGAPREEPSEGDRWDEVRSGFRSSWLRHYGTAGRRWEDYEPAYRYGWEHSRMPDYQGRSWSEVESELKSGWETRHYISPWERIVDAVKDAWEGITEDERADRDRAA